MATVNEKLTSIANGIRRITGETKKLTLDDMILSIENLKDFLDSTPPVVTISAPTGTLSTEPTYSTSSSYTVTGTVIDVDTGVAAVYVNNQLATLNGNNWSYSLTLTANSVTKISVVAMDNSGNSSAEMVRYVAYDSAAPNLVVSAPSGTSSSSPTYTSSASYTVKGTTSDALGIKSLTVNGNAVTVSSDGSWSYSISLTTNAATTIKVIATDKAGRTKTITRYAFYDSIAPTLTVTTPTATSSSSATIQVGTSISVTGTAIDAAGIKSVTVNGTAATLSGNNFSATITGSNSVNTITIVATDNAGRSTTTTRYIQCLKGTVCSGWDDFKISSNGTRRLGYADSVYMGKPLTFYYNITSISNGAQVNLGFFDTDNERWYVGKVATTAGIHKVTWNDYGNGYFCAAVGLKDAAAGYESISVSGSNITVLSGATSPSSERATLVVYSS